MDTRLFIGIFQEDERVSGVALQRPNLDLAITVIEIENGSLKLKSIKEAV